MRTYKKPMITVDSGLAEGVYAASGATNGTLNVTYYGVWDRWGTNGGKGLAMADWSDINGTITLNITFNDTVDQAETDNASVQTSWSGKTATFTFASTASNPLTIGIHLNHGTSIDDLKRTGFTSSVNSFLQFKDALLPKEVRLCFKTRLSSVLSPALLIPCSSYLLLHTLSHRYLKRLDDVSLQYKCADKYLS